MHFQPFKVLPHNLHYEGSHDEREFVWRQICALDKADNIQSLLAGDTVDSVLEVGCGTGAVLVELARRKVGRSHTGIDMADPQAHIDPAVTAAGIRLQQYDGRRLPFGDGSVDFVYASHVVEHVPDPRSFLGELQRVSRRYVYLEVPCELHMRANRDSLQRTLDIGHINAYTPESFVLLLQTAGMNVLRTGLFDHSLAVHAFQGSAFAARVKHGLRGTLLRISPQWASRCFTYHFGVLCERH